MLRFGAENGLTRATPITALTCFLVVGAAAASLLDRHSLADVRPAMASRGVEGVVSNTQGKQDRLAIATVAPASFERTQATASTQPLRDAFASTTPSNAASSTPADIGPPKIAGTLAAPSAPVSAPSRPKLASKTPPQKPYSLLSDTQIAGIKERLRLSSAQEAYWPAVETALRAVARKIHATHKTDPHATGAPIDPEAEEVQQLKSAAMPLLFQLREDQKREVRTLARMIGLENVAAQI
jgi:hypothetical protein